MDSTPASNSSQTSQNLFNACNIKSIQQTVDLIKTLVRQAQIDGIIRARLVARNAEISPASRQIGSSLHLIDTSRHGVPVQEPTLGSAGDAGDEPGGRVGGI